MRSVTNKAWERDLANAKPVIVVHHDTVQSPPITIIKRLNPAIRQDTTRKPIQITHSDSLSLFWGFWWINFWASKGYIPEDAALLQDSLTVSRTLEIRDKDIGYLKVLYDPLLNFNFSLVEIRSPQVSNDTTSTTPPIVIPKTFLDYLTEYAGWAVALIFLIVGIK